MDGKKTYIGVGLIVVSMLITQFAPDLSEPAQTLFALGVGLAGIGAAHKLEKARRNP